MLLDRCKEVFVGRGVGWKGGRSAAVTSKSATSGSVGEQSCHQAVSTSEHNKDADVDSSLFEVYDVPADEGNDALAHMLGEDIAS